jgi:hypothetical protein
LYAGAGISLRRRKSRDLAGKMLPGRQSLSTIRAMQELSGYATNVATRGGSTAKVFAMFLRLGLTCFGGPIAISAISSSSCG